MNIYLTIKQICERQGTTITELEQTLGLGKRSLYNWQRSSPSIDSVLKVADHFGISLDSLLGRSVSQAPTLSPESLEVARVYEAADLYERDLARRALGLELSKKEKSSLMA